ncbi:aromatic ring-hydroxylating oxygenase subunit alpha [Vulcanococcus limneticus]|uniref:aromatic ring-hydroxylating oxygenase subunit alpha n=1 Tax=Vulcanococcus limneticus TaxID=2170428 RepID=UPI00398BD4E7
MALPAATFLPGWVYGSAAVAQRERSHYAGHCWHPVAASAELGSGEALARQLLELPLLITRPADGEGPQPPRAFLNRCPHRGVALLEGGGPARPCRRLICPYHGWTYDLQGQLRAAAREGEFLEPFCRDDWPLAELPCRQLGPLIWVALGPDPVPLEQQLDLVLAEAGALWEQPRQLLARQQRPLACNWKVAHDNTLDDYHVAIAHPSTLHREQGPVRHYRHGLSRHGTLLATPWGDGGTFFTFGLAPWTHLLLWPDGRLALISFLPEASALDRCRMEVWLLGLEPHADGAEAWMAELQCFLEEDRRLVESAQRGYASGLQPGPVHRLEQRILQWQALYASWMELDDLAPDALTTAPGVAATPPWRH